MALTADEERIFQELYAKKQQEFWNPKVTSKETFRDTPAGKGLAAFGKGLVDAEDAIRRGVRPMNISTPSAEETRDAVGRMLEQRKQGRNIPRESYNPSRPNPTADDLIGQPLRSREAVLPFRTAGPVVLGPEGSAGFPAPLTPLQNGLASAQTLEGEPYPLAASPAPNVNFLEAVEGRVKGPDAAALRQTRIGDATGESSNPPNFGTSATARPSAAALRQTRIGDATGESSNPPNFGTPPAPMETKAPAASNQDRMMQLFKKATGTAFDPKSKRDAQALAEIQSTLSDITASGKNWEDMSDNQLAMQWYRSKSYGSQTGRKRPR
jgi:hypothetical protein